MQASPERDFALEVVTKLRDAGFDALWAGGCVRDLLLGGTPDDYDVATSATPEQVRELFGRRKTLAVGAAFGVIIVMAPRRTGGQVEVATFRTDAQYSDGRRPDSVTFSTAQEDALRRDFTINGMFYDPIAEEVIDYVEGQRDLQIGVIRAIGNASDRIAEDKLRMLRAIRFAARFDFEVEASTLEAIAQSAEKVSQVSSERISVETQKTLSTQRAEWAISQWQQLGLLSAILPELNDAWDSSSARALSLLGRLPDASDWRTKVAVLLNGVLAASDSPSNAETLVDSLKSRLKLSNADADCVRFAVTSQGKLSECLDLKWSSLQPIVTHPNIEAALDVFRARCELDDRINDYEALKGRIASVEVLDPAPLLNGQDLMKIGLRPSPQFSSLLKQIRELQLDGELNSALDAEAWVKKHAD